MQSKQPTILKLLTLGIAPAITGITIPSAHAGSATWNGSAATNVLNTAANWTAGGPPTGSGDTGTWDGTATGDLSLTWTAPGDFGAGPGAFGTNLVLTSTQTSSLLIASSSATALTNGDNFQFGNLTIASGAGAFTFGDGVGNDNTVFRNNGSPAVNLLTNNSSNTATFASNVYFNSGGGSARTFTFDGSGNWQVNSLLRFSNNSGMTVVKNGAGTLTLTGSTSAGGTGTVTYTINAGTLKVAGAGLLGGATLPGNVINNAAFSYESTASQTITGIVSGTGTLSQSAGTLILSGANTYGGATTITGGTLHVSGTGTLNTSSGITINGAGAKYLHTSTTSSTQNIALTQGTVAGTGSISAVTASNDAGAVIANGNANSAALTIDNLTFNGAASLSITDDGNTSTSGIIVSGALSTTPANGLVTVNASSSFWNSGTTYDLVSAGSFGGSISDFTLGTISGLTNRQSSSLVLNGTTIGLLIGGDSPKWSGLDNSNWVVGNTGANGNWKLINGGTKTNYIQGDVVLFNDSATNTTVTISGADVSPAVINFDNSSKNYTINGAFGIAAGAVNKNGLGNVTISTANTYSGGTTINAGTLTLSGAGTLGATSGTLTLAGGTVNLGGTSQTVGSLAISGEAHINNGTLNATDLTASNPEGSASISSSLDLGSGNLTKSGDGTLTLSGPIAYSGTTTITGGVLVLSGLSNIASSSGVTLGGGTLDLGGATHQTNAITISAAPMSMEPIANGTIEPTSLGFTATSGTAPVSANIVGTTGITLSPAAPGGTLSLSGVNTFTGPLNLAGPATVSIDGGSNTGGGAITYNSFGTSLTINSGSYVTSGITANGLSEFRTLNLNGGVLESSGNVFADTLAITINFNGGTLKSGSASGITVFDYNNLVQIGAGGATFDTTAGAITVGNNADMVGAGNVHIPTVNLPKINGTGGGTITLAGGNTLVAGITNSGLLDIQNSSAWDLNGIASSVDGLSGNGIITSSPGPAVLTINANSFSGPFTYSGNISGGANLALIKQGDGTQTLSGNITYQGNTTVAAGTLEVSNNTATTFHDGSTITIDSGAVLHLANATTDQVRGLVIGSTPLAPGIYSALSPETTGFITGSGQLEVVASVGFADFMGQFLSLTEAEKFPDADPDHDGIANLIEYAIDGLSPVEANAAPGALAGNTLTFTKRAAAVTNDDVTYGFEDSLDLGATDPWTVVNLPNSHVAETAGIISYTFNHLTDGARAFIRLRVTQN